MNFQKITGSERTFTICHCNVLLITRLQWPKLRTHTYEKIIETQILSTIDDKLSFFKFTITVTISV